MNLLPDVRSGDDQSPWALARAGRAKRATELRLFQRALQLRYQAEADRLEREATADAVRGSLDEELDLLDYGLLRANGSPAKGELVARKVEFLSTMNSRRLRRRFSDEAAQ